jgi:hypothetical protein
LSSKAIAKVILLWDINKIFTIFCNKPHRFGASAVRGIYDGRGSKRRFNFKERRNLSSYLFRFYDMQTTGVA